MTKMDAPKQTLQKDFGKEEEFSHTLFDGETEKYDKTDVETGIAYHAFLEKFDFSLLYGEDGKPRDVSQLSALIQERLTQLTVNNEIAGAELLSVDKLTEILQNPVFSQLRGAMLYKERQFLVSLPIRDTYALKEGVDERLRAREDGEEMLFQGAIDLLAVGADGVRIIDYKYSRGGVEYLRSHYKPQLDLYRLATSKILRLDPAKIRCTIVNICRGFEVDMDEKITKIDKKV